MNGYSGDAAVGNWKDEYRVVEERVTADDCTWGTFIHLAAFAGLIVPVLGSILGPLVLWLIKKDDSEFLDDHGREAVNFQISVILYSLIAAILTIICIGVPLLIALLVIEIVCPIVMAIKANRGEYVRYPVTIRFLRPRLGV